MFTQKITLWKLYAFQSRERRQKAFFSFVFTCPFDGSGIRNLNSFLAPGGTVWWSAQVDVTLETGIFFIFSDFRVMVSRQYQTLKCSLKLQIWLLIFILSSTHPDNPKSAPYIHTYTSSLSQDLQYNFKGTISQWIIPLWYLHLTFVFITFCEHGCFMSFQSSASSESPKRLTNFNPTGLYGSASSPVSRSPTWCHGTFLPWES